MSENISALPSTVQVVKRTQRGPDEFGIIQILKQDVEMPVSEFLSGEDVKISGLDHIDYGEITSSVAGSSKNIDWTQKNIQQVVLNDDCTFTFTSPGGAAFLTLEVIQDNAGGWEMQWPLSVDWTEGSPPASGTADKTIVVTLFFNSLRYRGQFTSYF